MKNKPIHYWSAFIIVWLLSQMPMYAQMDRIFTHLSLKDGLSQATVNCIYQDSRGLMWFGTRDGLNKYDGYDFTVYKYTPKSKKSLSHSSIRSLFEDSQKRLWVGTDNGLNLFNPKDETFQRFLHDPQNQHSISHNAIRAITEGEGGVLWIATSGGGLNRLTFQNEQPIFEHFEPKKIKEDTSAHMTVRALLKNRNGQIWLATDAGLQRLIEQNGTITFQQYQHDPDDPKSISTNEINSITEDKYGNLWIGTWGKGVEKLVFDKQKGNYFEHYPPLKNTRNSISQKEIITLKADRYGHIWIGTWGRGLNLISASETTKIKPKIISLIHDKNDPKSVSHNSIRAIYEDKLGAIWIGTYGAGISKIDPNAFKFIHYYRNAFKENSLSADDIWAMEIDEQGDWWIGTWGGGINRMRVENEIDLIFDNYNTNNSGLLNNKITALLQDRQKNLWIGTWGHGIQKIMLNGQRQVTSFKHYPIKIGGKILTSYNNIKILHEDKAGRIWIGSNKGFHLMLDTSYKNFYPLLNHPTSKGLSNASIEAICDDSEGYLWVGTQWGGINRVKIQDLTEKPLKNIEFEYFKHDENDINSLSSNNISILFEDSKKRIWIGTSGAGLNLFMPENDSTTPHFKHYFESDGLPNGVIQSILEDNEGNLWLSTNKGLSKFNPTEETFTNYDMRDGLQNNEFINHSSTKDADGLFYFGGINGFNTFNPAYLTPNKHVPPIILTDFKLNNEPVTICQKGKLANHISLIDELTLSYKDNIITFEFAALNYTLPEKNQYAYKLEGFDKTWHNIGSQRQVTFTNLDPGHYTLKIKGSNNDGVWNEKGIALKLIITPPFWATWWFKSIVVLLFLASIYAYTRYRIRFIKAEKIKLANLVEERTKEIRRQKQLVEEKSRFKEQFFSNVSHELRTPLNGILGMSHLLLKTRLNQTQKQFTTAIQTSADHLLVIVNDLLDISKINAGKLELINKPFDTTTLFSTLFDLFKPRADEKNIDLIFDIQKNVPQFLSGDQVRLYQILINLLGNALKFTIDGHVALKIEANHLNAEKIELILKVSDTGVGIASEKLDKIFNSFSQIIDNSGYHYEGTGLGLTIVQNLVQLHGGTIDVQSELGEGSTFTTRLPFAIPSKAVIKAEVAEQKNRVFKQKWKEKKVLLIEDNKINQLYAQNLFIEWDLNADTAENLIEANLRLTQYRYDCILADVKLPDGDGIDFIKSIRGNSEHLNHDTPVIVLTAGASSEQKARIKGTSIQAYLTKPFDALHLAAELSKVFGSNNFDAKTVNESNKIDYEYLEHLGKLMRYNKKHMISMLEVFLNQLPEITTNLEFAIIKEDWEATHFEAHKFKSTVKTIGLPKLLNLITTIDQYASEVSNTSEIPILFEAFKVEGKQEKEKLEQELEKLKAEVERLTMA